MDLLSLAGSIMSLLVPAFIIYIIRVGNFRTVKNEGKCFLVVLLICVVYGYKRSFIFQHFLGDTYILKLIMKIII